MKPLYLTIALSLLLGGCASITNDAYVPIAFSFSSGVKGECKLFNKRFSDTVAIPSTPLVRRSDDPLKYDCKTSDGREVFGSIPSTMGAKIVASAAFMFDFGIVDSITDKHREYPASFVIPVEE